MTRWLSSRRFVSLPIIRHPGSHMNWLTASKDMELESPVLMTGDNGVGKSIFAKILSNIIKPADGHMAVSAPNGTGHARLMFQDAIDQLFGKSIDGHLEMGVSFRQGQRQCSAAAIQ